MQEAGVAVMEGEGAQAGGGNAADLRSALESGTESTVKLTGDITIDARLDIARNVTVDLNGYVLRYDEAAEPDSIFRVTGGKTLTMTDSRPAAAWLL